MGSTMPSSRAESMMALSSHSPTDIPARRAASRAASRASSPTPLTCHRTPNPMPASRLLPLVAALGLAFAAEAVQAQSYPRRLIKLVVPTSAGGPTDGMARRLAEKLAPALGQTVIVENLAGGAGGTLGARAVA